jgi:hypothetical protein
MRYKPKSIAALHIALGGLPDKMRVEVDPGIQPSPKTVGELRKLSAWPESLAVTTPQNRDSESAVKVSKAKRTDTRHAENVTLSEDACAPCGAPARVGDESTAAVVEGFISQLRGGHLPALKIEGEPRNGGSDLDVNPKEKFTRTVALRRGASGREVAGKRLSS